MEWDVDRLGPMHESWSRYFDRAFRKPLVSHIWFIVFRELIKVIKLNPRLSLLHLLLLHLVLVCIGSHPVGDRAQREH